MVKKYNLKIFIFFIILITALLLIYTILIDSQSSQVYADSSLSINVYLKTTNEYTGEISLSYKGSFEYIDEGNYYLYGTRTNTEDHIGYYLNKCSVSSISIYDKNDEVIPFVYMNGAFKSPKSYGIPVKIEIFNPCYEITYELDGGINNSKNPLYYYSNKTYTLYPPTKEGYIFDRWYTDQKNKTKISSISSGTSGDLTIYAGWKKCYQLDVYISYLLNNNTNCVELVGQTKCYENPFTELYEYGTTNGNNQDLGMSKFAEEYNNTKYVIYDINDKELQQSFAGSFIYTSIDLGTPSKIILEPKIYKINYNLDGGENNSLNPNSYLTSSDVITLSKPIKEEYAFIGWYLDKECTQPIYSIDCSTNTYYEIYALWSKILSIPVNLILSTNYIEETTTISNASCFYYIPYNQYNFGKNDDSNPLASIISTYKDDYDITLILEDKTSIGMGIIKNYFFSNKTAKNPISIDIRPKVYTITYNIDGGENSSDNISSYNQTTPRTTLHKATKPGYIFIGWYLDENYNTIINDFIGKDKTNLILYACWSELKHLNLYKITTDGYELTNNFIQQIDYYSITPLNIYKYEINIEYILDKFECSYWYIADENNNDINAEQFIENTISNIENGSPACFYLYNTYYKINYELYDGIFSSNTINYYTCLNDLEKVLSPKKEGFTFLGWYLDENFEEQFSPTIFYEEDITLYALWSENFSIPLYYYDSSLDDYEYVFVGNIEYFKFNELLYCFETAKMKTYMEKYKATSFSVVSEDGNRVRVTSFHNMYFSEIEGGIPSAIYIYAHYFARFYVNGHYVGQCFGNKDDKIVFPTNITGFIGKNYDSISIGSLTIGKDYAVYIFKGWSLTDSSDITWFNNNDNIEIINEDIIYNFDDNNVTNFYAYMTFYGKTDSENKDIDYENFIQRSNGIITIDSTYTLDDLTKKHVTEIDSDKNKPTLFDKILDKINISKQDPIIQIIRKFISGEKVAFEDLWNTIFGKIIIFTTTILGFILFVKTFILLGKLVSQIQNKL